MIIWRRKITYKQIVDQSRQGDREITKVIYVLFWSANGNKNNPKSVGYMKHTHTHYLRKQKKTMAW